MRNVHSLLLLGILFGIVFALLISGMCRADTLPNCFDIADKFSQVCPPKSLCGAEHLQDGGIILGIQKLGHNTADVLVISRAMMDKVRQTVAITEIKLCQINGAVWQYGFGTAFMEPDA